MKRIEIARLAHDLDQFILTVPAAKLTTEEAFTSYRLPEVTQAVEDRCDVFPNYFPPITDGTIEWVYVLDLDDGIFTVNNCADFKLNEIPLDWEALLRKASIRQVAPTIYHPMQVCQQLQCEIVNPRSLTHTLREGSRAPFVPGFTYLQLSKQYEEPLRFGSPIWKPSDFVFKELSFALLCLASSNPPLFSVEDTKDFRGCEHQGFLGYVRGHKDQQKIEFMSRFLDGFHLPHVTPGSAPSEQSYMFQNVLVILVQDLTDPAKVKTAVAQAATEGNARGLRSFHSVVMSLYHIVLLQFFSDGHVEHTNSLQIRDCRADLRVKDRTQFTFEEEDEEEDEVEDEDHGEDHDETSGGAESREGENSNLQSHHLSEGDSAYHDETASEHTQRISLQSESVQPCTLLGSNLVFELENADPQSKDEEVEYVSLDCFDKLILDSFFGLWSLMDAANLAR